MCNTSNPLLQIDETVRREIQTHRKVYHTHIIAFKEAFLLPEHLAIVMEYASGEVTRTVVVQHFDRDGGCRVLQPWLCVVLIRHIGHMMTHRW